MTSCDEGTELSKVGVSLATSVIMWCQKHDRERDGDQADDDRGARRRRARSRWLRLAMAAS